MKSPVNLDNAVILEPEIHRRERITRILICTIAKVHPKRGKPFSSLCVAMTSQLLQIEPVRLGGGGATCLGVRRMIQRLCPKEIFHEDY